MRFRHVARRILLEILSWYPIVLVKTLQLIWKSGIYIHVYVRVLEFVTNCSDLTRTHYNDVIMSTMASQITSPTVVYLTVYTSADQRKHHSSASLAFVRGIHRGPVNSPHKGPVTQKMFPFDDVIILSWLRGASARRYPTLVHKGLNDGPDPDRPQGISEIEPDLSFRRPRKPKYKIPWNCFSFTRRAHWVIVCDAAVVILVK